MIQSYSYLKIQLVLTIFWTWIIANLAKDSIVFFLENLTVVSTSWLPFIIGNLSIDSMVFLLENPTVVLTILGLGL